MVDHKQIRDAILTSQRCQRNYDLSKTIPDEDLELIRLSLTQCPSKQNIAHYNVHMITDRALIEEIYEASGGIRANPKPGEDFSNDASNYIKNPQVLGQLCIVFTARNDSDQQVFDERTGNVLYRNAEQRVLIEGEIEGFKDKKTIKEQIEVDARIALGIAAGYSNLVASMLGYRSGCSSCMMKDKIKELLNLGKKEHPLLLMGIGHADPTRNRRESHYEPGFLFPSHTKEEIKVTWHK